MEMLDLIQLVDDTSSKHVLYTVTLLELPRFQVFVEEVSFVSSDETIQFLSDKELFGWEVKSWDFTHKAWDTKAWDTMDELRIVLYKMEENK